MSRIEEAIKKVASQKKSPIEKSAELVKQKRPITRHGKMALDGRDIRTASPVVLLKSSHLMLPTAREEKTAIVEAYDKLRSTIIALTKGENFLNTLMVTSTTSEEGKTMTALNLAVSLAKEHNYTALLVDCDLRRPSVYKYLDIPSAPKVGLIHCLRDNLPIEKALIKAGNGNLMILPAGGAVSDPVDMISSNRMQEIVRELKQRYPDRYIIFDSPPALPFADAGILAGIVDSILFVVREGMAKSEDIEKTLDDLKEHNFLGIVYNDAHRFLKSQRYHYYY